MEDKKLELIKAVLIHWLNQKLLRKDLIDKEIKYLTHKDDRNIDIEIANLERIIATRLSLLDRVIKYKKIKQDKIELSNLKIKKSLIISLRNQKIEELLQEKQDLAYNEYNYISRIEELSSITTLEELILKEEEFKLLNSIIPDSSFLSGIKILEKENKNKG